MKKRDIILIVSILILAGSMYAFKLLFSQYGEQVIITVDGKTYGEYSLNKNQIIKVNNHNTVVIDDGYAYMKDADCPDKLCINQGKINKDGETIVCLPNKTVIKIKSTKNSEYDAKSK